MVVIYLAHSVYEREEGKQIQVVLESIGYSVVNPFYPKTPRPDIRELDEGKTQPWTIINEERSKQIVKQDLRAVRLSDVVLAKIPEDKRTVGIPCEMMYAWMNKIPIYSLTKTMLGHPWIRALSVRVYPTFDELHDDLLNDREILR